MNNLERAEQVMSEYVDSVGGLTNLDEEYCGVLDGLAEALADGFTVRRKTTGKKHDLGLCCGNDPRRTPDQQHVDTHGPVLGA